MRLANRSGRPALLTALLSIAVALQAQTDLPVYRDAWLNGFQDRLWLSHSLANTSPVHAGAFSISVTPPSHWQGLYVHHAGLDTTPYASLSFWVNGGAQGGQRLQVQGLLGNANPPPDVYYRFNLPPDSWQQVTVPLAVLGVENKTNLTGVWIQLTPNGASNTFYMDDLQFNAKPAALAAGPVPEMPAAEAAARDAEAYWHAVALCIAGALVVMTGLLAWLITMLRRSGLGTSQALVPVSRDSWPQLGVSSDGSLNLPPGAVRRALEALNEPQSKALRDKVVAELAEFAKQSLVQGLYAQRGRLLETEQKAQAELAALEARLTALHLPLQERIQAYESRIGELTRELETRDEEMRHLIHTTLLLVRDRMEKEKAGEPSASRFN
jgi:hypothetical protein